MKRIGTASEGKCRPRDRLGLLAFCFLLLIPGCRKQDAIDLVLLPPAGMSLDLGGKNDMPPEASAFSQSLAFPKTLPSDAVAWLRYELPKDQRYDRLFGRHCRNILAIYQDGDKIKATGQEGFARKMISFASLRHSDQTSWLDFKVGLSEQGRFDLACKSLLVTTQNNAVRHYLLTSSPLFISGSLITLMALLTLALNLTFFSWSLVTCGLMALSMGIYVLSSLDISGDALVDAGSCRVLAIFIALISYLLFFEALIGSPRKIARLLAGITGLIAVGFQLIRSLDPGLYEDAQIPLLLLVVVMDMALAIGFGFAAAAQGKKFARPLTLMTSVLGLCLGMDFYSYMRGQSHDPVLMSPWIFLAMLVVTLISLLVSRFQEQLLIERLRTAEAERRNRELLNEVYRRTEDLSRRARDLEAANAQLEERIQDVSRQNQIASDVARANDQLLLQIIEIKKSVLPRIVLGLQKLHDFIGPSDPTRILALFDRIHAVFPDEEASEPCREGHEVIALLSANKRHQRSFKSSIGGARLDLRTAETVEALFESMQAAPSRLLVVDESFIERIPEIHARFPDAHLIAFSEKDSPTALAYQVRYPMLDQVITLDLPKPVLQKLLLTHLTKLVTHDIFGIEKYLMWGSAIKERTLDMREIGSLGALPESLLVDRELAGMSVDFESRINRLSDSLLSIRRHNLLTSGHSHNQRLSQLRYGYDAHVFALSIDLLGSILARQDIIAFFSRADVHHPYPLAAMALDQSHALILNSNGHDHHELIALLFQSAEETPPAYFYSFIFSE